MSLTQAILAGLGVLVTGLLGGGAVVVKILNRDQDRATTRRTEVDTLRSIIEELRAHDARKDERLTRLEDRVATLEERERHMLTRAAVHEAWDQLAFQALVAMNPDHPPPPPLTDGKDHS